MDALLPRATLHEAPLGEQIDALAAAIRSQPSVARLRIHLSQLCMLTGAWERAVAQLQTAAQLDAAAIPMAQAYREAIRCERQREQVFSGTAAAPCLGEPTAWFAHLVQALNRRCAGEHALADELQDQAFSAASESPFRIDGTDVAWLADGDSRLGPVCEVIVNGQYYWLPFESIRSIEIEAPSDLRDLVWTPATITLRNGGQHVALLPSRYPFSHARGDDRLARAALTVWDQVGDAAWAGFGQRIWVSEHAEHPLLAVRRIDRVEPTDAAAA